jgi:hypothetical protein
VAVIEPMIDPTIAWSVAESQRIANGTPQQEETPQTEEWKAIESASDQRKRSMNESTL